MKNSQAETEHHKATENQTGWWQLKYFWNFHPEKIGGRFNPF